MSFACIIAFSPTRYCNAMSRISLLGFLVVFPPFCQAVLTANSSSVIDSITIQGNTRTHTHVIRRELLFVLGDRLDSNLVAETARNLRRLLYLGNPDIHVQEEHGKATILVQVQDLYSRALSPQFSGAIEELSCGLIALDYNFLGRGQTAQLSR